MIPAAIWARWRARAVVRHAIVSLMTTGGLDWPLHQAMIEAVYDGPEDNPVNMGEPYPFKERR